MGNENLAPRARFELATLRLTAECSTIELPGNRAGRNGSCEAASSLANPPQKCQRTASHRSRTQVSPPRPSTKTLTFSEGKLLSPFRYFMPQIAKKNGVEQM